MAELMRVPEVAAGATDAVLSEWLVAEGDAVNVGDAVAVIETDKAQVEVEAEVAGVLVKCLAKNSERIEIGAPMAVLGTVEEAGGDLGQILSGLGVSDHEEARDPASRDPDSESVQHRGEGSGPELPGRGEPAASLSGRRFVSPIARRLLREARLGAADLTGSGPGGRITRDDVLAAIAAVPARAETDVEGSDPAPGVSGRSAVSRTMGAEPVEIIEHSRLRRAIASRLTASKQTIPHFYVTRRANMESVLHLRAELSAQAAVKVSVNDFVLRAVAHAHLSVPEANVIWAEDGMHRFDTVDIGVAIASSRGLVTPLLRSVEQMSLGEIGRQVKNLAGRANEGRLQQHELEGGTITVTNLGMFGVDEFSAIINPPQAAILAVGAGKPQPVAVEGRVDVATLMPLVLSVDHRAIDGALAAQWMGAVVHALENPFTLLVRG